MLVPFGYALILAVRSVWLCLIPFCHALISYPQKPFRLVMLKYLWALLHGVYHALFPLHYAKKHNVIKHNQTVFKYAENHASITQQLEGVQELSTAKTPLIYMF